MLWCLICHYVTFRVFICCVVDIGDTEHQHRVFFAFAWPPCYKAENNYSAWWPARPIFLLSWSPRSQLSGRWFPLCLQECTLTDFNSERTSKINLHSGCFLTLFSFQVCTSLHCRGTKPRYSLSVNQRPEACSTPGMLLGFSIIGSNWLLHMAFLLCTVTEQDLHFRHLSCMHVLV